MQEEAVFSICFEILQCSLCGWACSLPCGYRIRFPGAPMCVFCMLMCSTCCVVLLFFVCFIALCPLFRGPRPFSPSPCRHGNCHHHKLPFCVGVCVCLFARVSIFLFIANLSGVSFVCIRTCETRILFAYVSVLVCVCRCDDLFLCLPCTTTRTPTSLNRPPFLVRILCMCIHITYFCVLYFMFIFPSLSHLVR